MNIIAYLYTVFQKGRQKDNNKKDGVATLSYISSTAKLRCFPLFYKFSERKIKNKTLRNKETMARLSKDKVKAIHEETGNCLWNYRNETTKYLEHCDNV